MVTAASDRAATAAVPTPKPGSPAAASPHHSHSLPGLLWAQARGLLSLQWDQGPLEITGSSTASGAQHHVPCRGSRLQSCGRGEALGPGSPHIGQLSPLDALPLTQVMDTRMVWTMPQEARTLHSWQCALSPAVPTATRGRTRVMPQCLTATGQDGCTHSMFVRLSGDMPYAGGG